MSWCAHVNLPLVECKRAAAPVGRDCPLLTHRQLLREVWGPGSAGHSHELSTGIGQRFMAQPMGVG